MNNLLQIAEEIRRGCNKMFCKDCGSDDESGHNLGCSMGDIGIVYCGTKDLEEELNLCPSCKLKAQTLLLAYTDEKMFLEDLKKLVLWHSARGLLPYDWFDYEHPRIIERIQLLTQAIKILNTIK